MPHNAYKALAERLDALPNGFPPTDDGAELRLLAKLFTEEEAALAAQLRLTAETAEEVHARVGGDKGQIRRLLLGMVRSGLIAMSRAERGMKFALLPFAIGIYEYQFDTIDAEFAHLFEDYFQKAFGTALTMTPALTRVVPVGEEIPVDMEVRPYESARGIVDMAKAWGVVDCICRKQQALIGEPCEHPLDVCMLLSETSNAFDRSSSVKSQTRDEAMDTLRRASEAGLVHSVSNNQEGLWFICNCCTCSCAVLRGMSKLGMANVIARSAFVSTVDEDLCVACGICLDSCEFGALSLDDVLQVDQVRCVGCGLCVPVCPEEALSLTRRPEEEVLPPPVTEHDWRVVRSESRGLQLEKVL